MKIVYDSFGNVIEESAENYFMPIGFAGGLRDKHTKFVRFIARDYYPNIGRFTAPDPANDLSGDADLYDYCVDDPVSNSDKIGLALQGIIAPLFTGFRSIVAAGRAVAPNIIAGKAGALGISGAGVGITNYVVNKNDQKKSAEVKDTFKEAAGYVMGTASPYNAATFPANNYLIKPKAKEIMEKAKSNLNNIVKEGKKYFENKKNSYTNNQLNMLN